MTWWDWLLAGLALIFLVRGLLRGLAAQVFAFLGLAAALIVGSAVSPWVAERWADARPALVFAVLRWIVVVLASLSVLALAEWLGERLGDSMRESLLEPVDRVGGGLLGLASGVLLGAFLSLVALNPSWSSSLTRPAEQSRSAAVLVRGLARVCGPLGGLPVIGALARQVDRAARRTEDAARQRPEHR